MIARLWHGWTAPADGDAYEALLRTTVLPGIQRVAGYEGAYVLRREAAQGAEVEFIVLTLFDSWDAVRAFAGPEYETAVISPEAHQLLSRFDTRAAHYQVKAAPLG
jgi:heme-degrading monooxygenase HmoA